MSFVLYDLTFLSLFIILGAIFLYKRKQRLDRQGLLYLYRTKIGLKIIESTSKKYEKILRPLQYIILLSGYALMIFMVYALIKFAYIYLTSPLVAETLKVPILTPLFPYVDRLFGSGLLPPFYFTYWIITIAIIAISHEFAHGIIAKLNKIKVHSTGFGFLGPFIAFFVEPDEKQMKKSKIFSQLSILAAGTFANVLMTILFGIIMLLFFTLAFIPSGVYFNSYSASLVNISQITEVNGVSFEGIKEISSLNNSLISLTTDNISYYTTPEMVTYSLENNLPQIIAYDDSPALNANLSGAITEIDGIKTTSYSELNSTLASHKPGDTIQLKTIDSNNNLKEYSITLGEKQGRAFLGISVIPTQSSGLLSSIFGLISKIKNPSIYYQSSIGDFGIFIYNLLWWIVFINLGVALTNMIPVGIFDGGQFFYLSVLAITRRKKVADIAFRISTWFFILLVAALMLKWVSIFF
jgi:membrane-associated protease RseP (regulator of RpoE activity)